MKIFVCYAVILVIIGLMSLSKLEFHPIISDNRQEIITLVYHNESVEVMIDSYSELGQALEKIELENDVAWEKINQKMILKDGDHYVIPIITIQECISINTADSTLLQELKGIGPRMAERIVSYRIANGLFQKLEDLKEVKGIGDKLFEKIADSICL